ncbi:unnamed protein product [Trichogramma brassicae]|uniref:Uncharacterized protein n=1 Tax=Trichogramma brassicae TaxID=86971 RepID=A0A6H5IMW5_9HYME|nr:unnamed protein product [Trichogramma brassicae]
MELSLIERGEFQHPDSQHRNHPFDGRNGGRTDDHHYWRLRCIHGQSERSRSTWTGVLVDGQDLRPPAGLPDLRSGHVGGQTRTSVGRNSPSRDTNCERPSGLASAGAGVAFARRSTVTPGADRVQEQNHQASHPGAAGGRHTIPGGRGGVEPASAALWLYCGHPGRQSAGASEIQRKDQRSLSAWSRRSTKCGTRSRHCSASGHFYPGLHDLPENRGFAGVLEAAKARAVAKAWEATCRAVILPHTVYARHQRQGSRENHLRPSRDLHREPWRPFGLAIWLSARAIHGQCHLDRHLHCQESVRGKPLEPLKR